MTIPAIQWDALLADAQQCSDWHTFQQLRQVRHLVEHGFTVPDAIAFAHTVVLDRVAVGVNRLPADEATL